MRADHPLAKRKFLNAENFAGEPLVVYAAKRHAFVDMVLAPAGVQPGRLRQVRMTEAIVELARAGQGIAVLAGWVLNDLVSKHDLAAVRIFRGGYHRTWRAQFSERCPEPLSTSFTECVRIMAKALDTDHWRERLEVA
jgi:LysR family transcriptional regulator for metE and metH